MNYKNKYDWNNDKEIDDKKLFQEFVKASLINKLCIYRLLVDKKSQKIPRSRRKMLRRKWDKSKKIEIDLMNIEHIKYVLEPLLDYIDIQDTAENSDVKNIYEMWLIVGIAYEIGLMPLTEEKAINTTRDRDNFNETKKRMIEYIKEFNNREWGPLSDMVKDDPLLKSINELKYVEHRTKKSWELQERNNFLKLMYASDIGKERAKRIIKSLEEWSQNAPDNRSSLFRFSDYEENYASRHYNTIREKVRTKNH